MNIVICDDDKTLLAMKKEVCEKYIKCEDSIYCYLSSIELKKYLLVEKPQIDLFILDIEMPKVNGIDLKILISKLYKETNIIFVTECDDYMKKAFGKKVIGYWSEIEYKKKVEELLEKIRNEEANKKIIEIPSGKNIIKLREGRIFSISAQRIYSMFRYAEYYNADNYDIKLSEKLYRISLREWEEKLDSIEFCRVNRSTIIAWRYVKEVADKIEMINGESYCIPAGKKKILKEKYLQYYDVIGNK